MGEMLPKHRFTEYSKAQFNIQLLERRKRRNMTRNKSEEKITAAVN